MGIFKKRRTPDVIDFREMQKRGIVKETEERDFSNLGTNKISSQKSETGGFDFLSLAKANNSKTASESPGYVTDSLRNARKVAQSDALINELKIKVDDNDFKINSLTAKVRELENKLRMMEKR